MTKDASSNELGFQQDRLTTLGVLSAGLVHEINNHLGYVLSNLRFVSEGVANLEVQLKNQEAWPTEARPLLAEWAKALAEALEGVQSIHKLVRDIKGFARGDSAERECFALQDVIESSLRVVGHELKHRALLEKHFEALLPPLHGNPSQIQQVFVNLLMNASQALEAPPGGLGKVEIRLSREEEGICATIRDNGCGISSEDLEKVCQPFFSKKPSGKGTGLGLFICRQLVAGHGGHMRVESRPGEGTSVQVWLPAQNPSPAVAEP